MTDTIWLPSRDGTFIEHALSPPELVTQDLPETAAQRKVRGDGPQPQFRFTQRSIIELK